jgi:hypothetical protein
MVWEESVMGKSIELSEVIQEMKETRQRLNIASKEIFKLASAKAEAERKYQVAKHNEIIKQRTEGFPATLISDSVRGSETVADLRFERDIAREIYNSGKDSMKATITEASLLQTISKYQTDL